MKLKLDLHVHTCYSSDCDTKIDDITSRCTALGLDGYAITDHDTIDGISEAIKKKEGLIVLPGLEVSAKGAHILALGIKKMIPSGLSIKNTVNLIHAQGARAILAHPYRFPWRKISHKFINAGFNAIEVANSSQFPFSYVMRRNIELARLLGVPKTGGSDSHITETVGKCYTVIDSKSNETGDVLNVIFNSDNKIFGNGVSLKERLKKILKV